MFRRLIRILNPEEIEQLPTTQQSTSGKTTTESSDSEAEPLVEPSQVREILEIITKATRFPAELVDLIAVFAQLFAVKSIVKKEQVRGQDLNLPYLAIALKPEELANVQSIVQVSFKCKAHDQGWATDGGSWTWAELSLSPIELTQEQLILESGGKRTELYRNQAATAEYAIHSKTFTTSDDLLREFNPKKHQIVLWIRSMFPGWIHYIKYAEIKIFYTVN